MKDQTGKQRFYTALIIAKNNLPKYGELIYQWQKATEMLAFYKCKTQPEKTMIQILTDNVEAFENSIIYEVNKGV